MQGYHLILVILSKLGPEYLVFISTFHTTKLTSGTTWKMPLLDAFIESLINEKDKLIKIIVLKKSKVHALVVHESNNIDSKSK
jgi:hypothetical protein